MGDLLLWIVIFSLILKIIFQIIVDKPKNENFKLFFYFAKMPFIALVPIKKATNNKTLMLLANACLIIFYISFALLCVNIF